MKVGQYVGVASNPKMTSTMKGKPQVEVTLVVNEGKSAGEEHRWNGSLVGGAIDVTVKTLRTMGYIITKGGITGRPVKVGWNVEEETYEGRTRPKVTSIYKPSEELSKGAARDILSAMMAAQSFHFPDTDTTARDDGPNADDFPPEHGHGPNDDDAPPFD